MDNFTDLDVHWLRLTCKSFSSHSLFVKVINKISSVFPGFQFFMYAKQGPLFTLFGIKNTCEIA